MTNKQKTFHMKEIIKYVAKDGKEFSNKSKCIAYENLIDEVAEIMSAFPPEPEGDGCKFANGQGYIQHKEAYFTKAKREILAVARRYSKHHWLEDDNSHPSYAMRIIGELNTPLHDAWLRIYKTDKEYREFGQVYYAEHPEKAEQFDIYASQKA